MAIINSYETLLTAIGDYVARDDLTTFVPNFVQNWEERFYRQPLNWGPWMESALVVTTTAATVPTDFLGLKYAYLDTSPATPLERKSASVIRAQFPLGGGSGRPRHIGRDRGVFVFGPAADSSYDVRGTYYAKPQALRTSLANWLTSNAPDLCLYGSLLEAEPFLKNDARIAVWRDYYTDALADYRDLIRDEDHMGSPMQAVLG